ncbi:DUF397 domain-containing protein [Frankia sp. AgKG'84/4]|nr:DUF397 domain-containing protein [Frankia sp. AgKG'84/4]
MEVRDSKNPDGPRLTFTAKAWRTLTAALLASAPTGIVTHGHTGEPTAVYLRTRHRPVP